MTSFRTGSRRWLPVLWPAVAGLMVGVGWLTWQGFQDPPSEAPWRTGEPSWEIGNQKSPGDEDRGAVLHVALQSHDCPDTGLALDRLAAALQERNVPMRGILLGGPGGPTDLEDPAEIGEELGYSFPVKHAQGPEWTRTLRSLGFQSTPAVLLVDAEGRLRSTFPGELVASRTTEIIDYVLTHAHPSG